MSELISFIEVTDAYRLATERMTKDSKAWEWETAFAEEIIKITAPSGFASWKDAAIDERMKRVAIQRQLKEITEIADELHRVGFDPTPTHQIFYFKPGTALVAEEANRAVQATEEFWSKYFGQLYRRCADQGKRIKEIIGGK